AAAAVGTGVVEDKKAFTTIGTSGVLFAHTSKMQIDKKGRVHTFCCAVPNEWHVMGVTQAAGLSMKWLRDTLCQEEILESERQGIDSYILLDKMAKDVSIGANKLLYLPYLMGERTPHLDPDARGVLFGLSAMHTKADIIRAVLEGVSYSLRDCIEILREMDVDTKDMMVCGGGAKSPIWRQMLADLYSCDVKTLASNEGAALGAAILAFVGAGEFDTVQSACKAIVKTADCHPPIKENSDKYEVFYRLYQSLYPNLKESYQALAQI
ncbi:MAG: FGGY-family carbohydrate kinase, partial [Oscillospiraceae bacterium]